MTEERRYHTIKQVADELGVTKQAIRQKLLRNTALSEQVALHTVRVDGTIFYDDEGYTLVKSAFADYHGTRSTNNVAENAENTANTLDRNKAQTELIAVLQKTVDTLTEQVTQKDKQINELSEMLKAVQTQNTALTDALTAAQALHAGTIQNALTEHSRASDEVSEQEPKRRGFFARFRRG